MKLKSLLVPSVLCFASLQAPAALIAGYTFDEVPGSTTAADSSSRGAIGIATLNGGATFGAGQIGNALILDGVNDWASALNPVVDNQSQLTVAAWVNVTARQDWGTIVKDWASTATFHFGLQNNTFTFSNFIGGSGTGPVTTTPINLGEWNHVAFTFDDATDTQNIYLNGTLVGTTALTPTTGNTPGTLATGGGTMGIGASTVPAQFMNGKIDDLAFYNTVLSAGDISTMYNNGKNLGISAIPEPAAALLGSLGLLGLLRRRR